MKSHELTDDELQELKKRALDALSHSRHILLSKYPFIGSIALRMDLVPVRDIRVRTACTDGSSVYFDIAFLSSLSPDERIFVLAHEIWHAVLLHLTRRGTRNMELFNIATDKEVNYLLKSDGLTPPPNLCFPEDNEVGKCAEEIYEMMLKKMKKNKQNKQQNSSNQSGSSNSSSSQNRGNSQKNSQSNSDNSGNSDGKLSGQFDKHIYDDDTSSSDNSNSKNNRSSKPGNQPNKNGDGDDDGENTADGSESSGCKITDKYGEVGFDSDFTPQVPKNFADRMRETVIAEAQRIEKMKGNIPSHIKELVKKMTSAEIKWQEVLAQFVTRSYNSGKRTWIPPNRRHIHNDVYLQSRQGDKIRLACVIDTSGSTCGDRTKFLSELNGLVKSFGVYDLHMICCDADVQSYKLFTQDDNADFEVDGFEFAGGGGTVMTPALDYILDNQLEVDAIILLTDGYIDTIPKNPTGLPTLWIITKNGTEDFCDWGQKIRLKQDDNDIA